MSNETQVIEQESNSPVSQEQGIQTPQKPSHNEMYYVVLFISAIFFFGVYLGFGFLVGYRTTSTSGTTDDAGVIDTRHSWQKLFDNLEIDTLNSSDSVLRVSFFLDRNSDGVENSGEAFPEILNLSIKKVGDEHESIHLASDDGSFTIASLPKGEYEAIASYSYRYSNKSEQPDALYTFNSMLLGPSRGDKPFTIRFSIPAEEKSILVPLTRYEPERLVVTTDNYFTPSRASIRDAKSGFTMYDTYADKEDFTFYLDTYGKKLYTFDHGNIFMIDLSQISSGKQYITYLDPNYTSTSPRIWISAEGKNIAYEKDDEYSPTHRYGMTTSTSDYFGATISHRYPDGQSSDILQIDSDAVRFSPTNPYSYLVLGYTDDTELYASGAFIDTDPDEIAGYYVTEQLVAHAMRADYWDDDTLLLQFPASNRLTPSPSQSPEDGSSPETTGPEGLVLYDITTQTTRQLYLNPDIGSYEYWASPFGNLYAVQEDNQQRIDLYTVRDDGNTIKQQKLSYEPQPGYKLSYYISSRVFFTKDAAVVWIIKDGCESEYCEDKHTLIKVYPDGKTENVFQTGYTDRIVGYFETP